MIQIDAIVRNWCLKEALKKGEIRISRKEEEGIPYGISNIGKLQTLSRPTCLEKWG